MKLLVLGAAGKTGKAVVEQALSAGHEVTAFLHMPDESTQTAVRVVVGDARDRESILTAMRGQDAVLDALGGHLPFVETTLETDTARNVIEAMTETGVRRLIVVSTIGEGESGANVHSFYKHFVMPTLLRGVMKDKASMEAEVKASAIDWTIVRPAGLTDGERKGIKVVLPETGEKVRFITRADLAQFMIEQLGSSEYVHQAVGIANPED